MRTIAVVGLHFSADGRFRIELPNRAEILDYYIKNGVVYVVYSYDLGSPSPIEAAIPKGVVSNALEFYKTSLHKNSHFLHFEYVAILPDSEEIVFKIK